MSNRYLLGLLGHPVSQSMSPLIHEAALKCAGLEGKYELHDVACEDLDQFISYLKEEKYKGVNVTIPYKLQVMDYLDKTSEEAKLVGAVNTIKIDSEHDTMTGFNTDIYGFKKSLEAQMKTCSSAFVYGYGGSSRAVLLGLAQLGFNQIYVAGRRLEKIEKFVSDMAGIVGTMNQSCQVKTYKNSVNLSDIDLIVNCSPIGQNENIVPEDFISYLEQFSSGSSQAREKLVFDLVYSKDREKMTQVVELATSKFGLIAWDGYEMLIHQALKSFELWTGCKISSADLNKQMEF